MKIYKIFQKLFKPKKCKWINGVIICPRCGAMAFTENETPKWMTKGHCFRCGKYLFWDTAIKQFGKESIVMVDNKTFRDISWLLAKLYIATEDLGECSDEIPEFRTLCERYGVEFWGTFSAEEVVSNGIARSTNRSFQKPPNPHSKLWHGDI